MVVRKFAKQVLGVCVASAVATSAYKLHAMDEEFYNEIAMPLISNFDPEFSHRFAIWMLKLGLSPESRYHDPHTLETKFHHLSFYNPVGIAAGFDKHGEAVSELYKMGFGFVEVGSVTPEPQEGNDKPRVFRLEEDNAVINRCGFNSDGHEAVYERLKRIKLTKKWNHVLGINLGKNKNSENAVSDYTKGITKFGDIADYFVINISSPNTPGLRDLHEKESLKNLLCEVLTARNELHTEPLPLVLLKLSPDLSSEEKKDIAELVTSPECAVDGLIISNTTVQRPSGLQSFYQYEKGGLSGKPLKDISTEMIREMYILTEGRVPIIGVGGIFSGQDAYEKIQAGATLVQLYTSFTYHGPPVVNKIKRELHQLLSINNYSTVIDAVGTSAREL